MEELDIEIKVQHEVDNEIDSEYDLIVLNDEINTFNHVIISLMQVCDISQQRAVECTLLIHHEGECTVLSGEEDEMSAMRDGLNVLGIDAVINKN